MVYYSPWTSGYTCCHLSRSIQHILKIMILTILMSLFTEGQLILFHDNSLLCIYILSLVLLTEIDIDKKASFLKSQIECFLFKILEIDSLNLPFSESNLYAQMESFKRLKELEKDIIDSKAFIEYWRINFLITIFGEIPSTFKVIKVIH